MQTKKELVNIQTPNQKWPKHYFILLGKHRTAFNFIIKINYTCDNARHTHTQCHLFYLKLFKLQDLLNVFNT